MLRIGTFDFRQQPNRFNRWWGRPNAQGYIQWGGAGARAGITEAGLRATGSGCVGGAGFVTADVNSCPTLAIAVLRV